eukprot:TRINITY_DN13525_c0_g1_i1.p1 TRINITY_DN13525_c0_g1~~TRINITY_DN13525_c0_g1_i1.p1  ORF type:complete len:420 (-),score=105.52 TRINITY_DN13525_c0_g1_i1:65-1324(-)
MSTKAERPKVTRYWPGKAPTYAFEDISNEIDKIQTKITDSKPLQIEEKFDKRLQRLQEGGVINRQEALARRHAEVAEVVSEGIDEQESVSIEPSPARVSKNDEDSEHAPSEDEEDEEEIERRRAFLRDRLRQNLQVSQNQDIPVEDVDFPAVKEEDDTNAENKEDSSEYETDSEEEDVFPSRPSMIPPVFVRRDERDTIRERERIIEEETALEKQLNERKEERAQESKEMVREIVQENIKLREEQEKDPTVKMEDEGEEDEQQEYEKWKVRELARIRREKEEREQLETDKAEIEKRRNMTDAEIKQLDKDKFKPKDKKKYKFLQKYYHSGAFFQHVEEDIYHRDVSLPTGEDKIDKSILPKVMQVKNFGRSGRTKWTHLVNEDTTDFTNPKADASLLRKSMARMGGVGPVERQKRQRIA